MSKPGTKLPEKTADDLRTKYVEQTAASVLDGTFGIWDTNTDKFGVPHLDRADHIIIGGRTATELLLEKYNAEVPNMKDFFGSPLLSNGRVSAYGTFYSTIGKSYLNQLITAALANKETVEVFVPDKKTGKIQDTPMRRTATGYEPTGPMAKPKQLNGWQKFWGKLGFYKKERQAVQEYEARQKVQFCNNAARATMVTNTGLSPYYREELREFQQKGVLDDMAVNFPDAKGDLAKLKTCNGFVTDRSSFYAIMICKLAAERDPNHPEKFRYTTKEIFDVNDKRMRQVRAATLKEIYDKYKKGAKLAQEEKKKEQAKVKGEAYEIKPDVAKEAKEAHEWLADIQYLAADAIVERVNIQAAQLDFTQLDITAQGAYREFALLADTAFDLSQDMQYTAETMKTRHGANAYWDATGKVGDWSKLPRRLGESMMAQKRLLNNVPGKALDALTDQLSLVFQAQAFRQAVGNGMQENRDKSFTEIATVDVAVNCEITAQHAGYDSDAMVANRRRKTPLPKLFGQSVSLAREQMANPERFGKRIINGTLEGRFKLQGFIPDKEYEVEFVIQDAATAEREMQRRQRRQERTGGGLQVAG